MQISWMFSGVLYFIRRVQYIHFFHGQERACSGIYRKLPAQFSTSMGSRCVVILRAHVAPVSGLPYVITNLASTDNLLHVSMSPASVGLWIFHSTSNARQRNRIDLRSMLKRGLISVTIRSYLRLTKYQGGVLRPRRVRLLPRGVYVSRGTGRKNHRRRRRRRMGSPGLC